MVHQKIPTVIYYDRNSRVQAIGAETLRDGIQEQAEDEGWVKAEWCVVKPLLNASDLLRNLMFYRFKLHLRSRLGPGAGTVMTGKIPSLPPGKTVVEVFADFLVYLLGCASKYIQETHAQWCYSLEFCKRQIEFVLSHPNGWEGTQQSQMRKGRCSSQPYEDTIAGNARLSFVTEGEASLHFAIQNGLPEGAMKVSNSFKISKGNHSLDIERGRSCLLLTLEEAQSISALMGETCQVEPQ